MDKRIDELLECRVCPRECGINRYEKAGYCRADYRVFAAKAFLHRWEEPCISGEKGSGTVFFSNCNLGCVFCQNDIISHEGQGSEVSIERLSEIYLELQVEGANNINLVTPTHYTPQIRESLILAKKSGLKIPVVYNSNGFERIEALRSFEGLVDIYLPDIKYFNDKHSQKYSKVTNYFGVASKAVLEMHRQIGNPVFENEILQRGLMVRHLMLPGLLFDSKKIVDWVADNLPPEVYLNIMCQYTPMNDLSAYPEINKKLNRGHYETLLDYALARGIENGFFQDFDSAAEEYVPDFNLEGIQASDK
jgi:putative pyruvate formate lyase activating enzyme